MADTETGASEWWKLAHMATVVDATLVALGHEPKRIFGDVCEPPEDDQPKDYLALKIAILNAVGKGDLPGHLITWNGSPPSRYPFDVMMCDPTKSIVEIASLFSWLETQGFQTGPLLSNAAKVQGVRDPNHPRYSSKLAAAIAAWEAFDEAASGHGTAKQRLQIWLRQHAAEFGLVDERGIARESVIQEISIVANWATTGGAPKKLKVRKA
jgi:hypothetical protein